MKADREMEAMEVEEHDKRAIPESNQPDHESLLFEGIYVQPMIAHWLSIAYHVFG